MTARLLEGGPIAAEIRDGVAADVASFTRTEGRPPGLRVVIVGRDAPLAGQLAHQRLGPDLRWRQSLDTGRNLGAGIRLIEVTLTTRDALSAIVGHAPGLLGEPDRTPP